MSSLKYPSPAMPDVPAIAETIPGYRVENGWGVVAPNGTPTPIIAKWTKVVNETNAKLE